MGQLRSWVLRGALAVCALAALAGCGQGSAPTVAPATSTVAPTSTAPAATATTEPAAGAAGAVVDVPTLIDYLESKGLTVTQGDEIQQPFLNTLGTTLNVSGGALAGAAQLEAYHYQDVGIAEEDAAGIGPDGSPPTMMITWVAPPHFYRSERVIVLYVGSDTALTEILTEGLGPQFAGL